jgi:carotenoid 1,2-hydratase
MAILDLFDPLPLSRADHWHRVGAPGGYEWWEFDALDDASALRVIVRFHDGFALDPEYAGRYDAYRRKPTVHSPPVPRQYPCVQFTVLENDSIVAGNTIRFGEGTFRADAESGTISIGDNRLELGDGETRVRFQGGDPAVSGEMIFKSRFSALPLEQAIFLGEIGTQHRWVLPQPRCGVSGQISFNGRQVRLDGIGYHDHYYGTGPIGPSVRRWLRGRAILPDRTVAFDVCTDHASGVDQFTAFSADDTHVARIDGAGCSCDWNQGTWRGLIFPSAVNFGESLVLRRPRIVDSSQYSLQVLFDAYVDGESCKAWGEITYPVSLHKGLVHCGVMKWLEG